MRPATALAAALWATLATQCSAPCPPRALCGASSWATTPSTGGGWVVLPVVQVVSPAGASDARIDVGAGNTLVGFDVRALAGRGRIMRAMLSLVPHPAWHPTLSRLRLTARAVGSDWQARGGEPAGGPALDPAPCAELVLPAGARTPVRLDVTAALAALDGRAIASVALSLEGGDAVFVGPQGLAVDSRPRVEVELAP